MCAPIVARTILRDESVEGRMFVFEIRVTNSFSSVCSLAFLLKNSGANRRTSVCFEDCRQPRAADVVSNIVFIQDCQIFAGHIIPLYSLIGPSEIIIIIHGQIASGQNIRIFTRITDKIIDCIPASRFKFQRYGGKSCVVNGNFIRYVQR